MTKPLKPTRDIKVCGEEYDCGVAVDMKVFSSFVNHSPIAAGGSGLRIPMPQGSAPSTGRAWRAGPS